jgi:putative effector of murein hydrolase
MTLDTNAAWTALTGSPVLDIAITVGCYQFGLWCYLRSGRKPFLLPVFVGFVLTAIAIFILQRPVAAYLEGTQPMTVLLGPVTVALAVPLYENLYLMARLWWPLLLMLVLTAISVCASTLWLADGFGASQALSMSLAPKAATTPIAILIAEAIGGYQGLAAVAVMLTGILGAMFGPSLLRRLGVTDDAALGFALGLSAHAVGTARGFEISKRCGAFAALGMSLMGLTLAIALPLILA